MLKPKTKLKRKIRKLKTKIKGLKAELNARKIVSDISPLAPPLGFPELPEIRGVTYAAGAAGVSAGCPWHWRFCLGPAPGTVR